MSKWFVNVFKDKPSRLLFKHCCVFFIWNNWLRKILQNIIIKQAFRVKTHSPTGFDQFVFCELTCISSLLLHVALKSKCLHKNTKTQVRLICCKRQIFFNVVVTNTKVWSPRLIKRIAKKTIEKLNYSAQMFLPYI